MIRFLLACLLLLPGLALADYPVQMQDPPAWVEGSTYDPVIAPDCVLPTQCLITLAAMDLISDGYPFHAESTGSFDPVCGMPTLETCGNVIPCPCGGEWDGPENGDFDGWCVGTDIETCPDDDVPDCLEDAEQAGCEPIEPAPVPVPTPEPVPTCELDWRGRVVDDGNCLCPETAAPPSSCVCTVFGPYKYTYRTCGSCNANYCTSGCYRVTTLCADPDRDCTTSCQLEGYAYGAEASSDGRCLRSQSSPGPREPFQRCECYLCPLRMGE